MTRLPSLGEEGNKPATPQHLPNVVEAYVLLSKSCRWPEERVPSAIELLDEASRLVDSTSPPEDRVHLRSRVACGLARLGQFYKAREFAAGASLDDNLELAREMLSNEYETANLDPGLPAMDQARFLGRVRRVFDEQVDVRRPDLFGHRSPPALPQ